MWKLILELMQILLKYCIIYKNLIEKLFYYIKDIYLNINHYIKTH
jgi:hypothetical protein